VNASLATVVIPFDHEASPNVAAELDRYADYRQSDGNHARLARKLTRAGDFVHFMAMTLVPPPHGGTTAHLALELSADGTEDQAIQRVAALLGDDLAGILRATGAFADGDAGEFLERSRARYATGWLRQAGLPFVGTPDLSVRRILDEAALATHIRGLLSGLPPGSAMEKLQAVRAQVFPDPACKWAFVCEPIASIVGKDEDPDVVPRLWTAIKRFGWPIGMAGALGTFVGPVLALRQGVGVLMSLVSSVLGGIVGMAVVSALFATVAGIGYARLRREERDDVPRDREPESDAMASILASEDRDGYVQNHLIGVSQVKPGWVRRFTLRLALAVIGEGAKLNPRPGYLDKIGSIHFARWIKLHRTGQLLFLSNYDGSWQSYLEDFIARLRQGLTSVWSNTVDFPKTSQLVNGGAGDGSRFKRWARRQQLPNTLWYSAYPDLTTNRIRLNASIRHGFAAASSEQEATEWLASFGYAGPESVEFAQIPTLAFGGLSTLHFAHALVLTLPAATPAGFPARDWLRDIEHDLTYGNRKPNAKALVAGFTASGMLKLGIDRAALATFPIAFQQGMGHPLRIHMLGDDRKTWQWRPEEVDAMLLVYGEDEKSMQAEAQRRIAELERRGGKVSREVSLVPLPESFAVEPKPQPKPVKEAFGFTDGISQPVMRGTVRGSQGIDPLHSVNPGELVLGYRDNLGIVAPTPRAAGRDLGRNGTYLVVRQLAQDAAAFNGYLAQQAQRLIAAHDPRIPAYARQADLEEWLAAKLVGRWRDGTSLVRNPNEPGMKHRGVEPDNDFLFGREDPEGLRCPLGAHVRRANPRDSFDPGSSTQVDISNRHRILRVGRSYVDKGANGEGRPDGLLFMCVNADIERQFEFLQQSWILGRTFHGLDGEVDPIVGCGGTRCVDLPTPNGPLRLGNLSAFVTSLGGGYFFMPGRAAVHHLANP
jgi:Dyp-type peroxidase family